MTRREADNHEGCAIGSAVELHGAVVRRVRLELVGRDGCEAGAERAVLEPDVMRGVRKVRVGLVILRVACNRHVVDVVAQLEVLAHVAEHIELVLREPERRRDVQAVALVTRADAAVGWHVQLATVGACWAGQG